MRTRGELQRAAGRARPGTRIAIAPGTYRGGLHLAGLAGTQARPVVLAAQDPDRPPVFQGGGSGLHLSGAVHVTLEDLVLEGATGNGLNVDDGGGPTHHVTLRRITVRDVGPRGNRDGIKCSGVDDLFVKACIVQRWGTAGSALDLVGCHRVRIESVVCTHTAGLQGGSGVQAKGGCADVTIRRCVFRHAGARGVNAGGSTGFAYFRPSIEGAEGPLAEARGVRVLGCTFEGGGCAVAFVGVDGAEVRWNTIVHPGRWAFRILQETRDARFVSAQDGVVAHNLVVFRRGAWAEGGVNVGAGTAPETFRFEANAWYCEDAPGDTRRLVRPPVEEKGGVYGVDPRLVDPAQGDLRIGRGSKLRGVGAESLPKGR